MDELLDKIKNSEMLTDEVKQELSDGIKTRINEAIESASKAAEIEVRATLTEQYVEDFNLLTEAIDTKVARTLKAEIEELKEDINNFRDLEVEYADRLVKERADIAVTVKSDMKKLIEMLDTFIGDVLKEELDELKEDIADVKQLAFGREIFESVANTFRSQFVKEYELFETLKTVQAKLDATESKYAKASVQLDAQLHEMTLNSVMDSLQGKPRNVMSAVLKNVPTAKLEETYNKYIGRVLSNHVQQPEKENDIVATTLTEGVSDESSVLAESIASGTAIVKNGNTTLAESVEERKEAASDSVRGGYAQEIANLKRQAGIII